MSVEFKDNFVLVRGMLKEEMEQYVTKAAIYLEGEIKRKLGTGVRTGKIYPVPGTKRKYRASAPGEPPAVMLSDLMNSITHLIESQPNAVIGIVGTNKEYARRLEFGFMEEDSLGRKYNQEPRPYFRSTYNENREKIKDILQGK
jgi:phage gpG-like protein